MAISFVVVPSLSLQIRSTALEENVMTATYTFDVFSSLDGFGAAGGNWTGYWGKQGPELLEHRLAQYSEDQRMVFGPKRIGRLPRRSPRVPRGPMCVTHGSHA